MKNKSYDILAKIGRIVLCVAILLYVLFAEKLGLPPIDSVTKTIVGSIAAVQTTLNVILETLSKLYFSTKEIVDNTTLDGGKGE